MLWSYKRTQESYAIYILRLDKLRLTLKMDLSATYVLY